MSWSLNPFRNAPALPRDTRRVHPSDPVAARLPVEASAKLAALKSRIQEAGAVGRMYSEEYRTHYDNLLNAESNLELALRGSTQTTLMPNNGTMLIGEMVEEVVNYRALPEEDVQIQQLRERVRYCKAEFERVRQLRDANSGHHQAVLGLVTHLIRWIERWPADARLMGHAPVTVSAKLLGNLPAALDKCGVDRRHLLDKRDAILTAPLPRAEAKRRARVQIMNLAKQGEPNIFDLLDHRQAQFRWAMSDVKGVPDIVALLAWFSQDELIRRIEETIDQRADDANALTDVEKDKRIVEINASLLYEERLEEAIICAAEQAGVSLVRRVDADPRAVLGLSDALPPEGA